MLQNQSYTDGDRSSNSRSHDAETTLRRYSQCIDELRQRSMEEIRQQQVYEAFKQDVAPWIQVDTFEDDPFGLPQFFIGDLIENPNNATPTLSPALDDHHILTSRTARSTTVDSHDSYLTNEEALIKSSTSTSPHWQNSVRCCCGRECRPPQRRSGSPSSPPYGEDGLTFWHSPTDEEVRQACLRRDQELDLVSPPTTTSVQSFSQVRSISDIGREGLQDLFDGFLASGYYPGNSSIRDIGRVYSKVVIRDDRSERAHAPSHYGEISNMSTPDLIRDDETIDLENLEQEEIEADMSDHEVNLSIPADDNTTSFYNSEPHSAQSIDIAVDFEDDEQSVIAEKQNEDGYTFHELESFEDGIPMPQNSSATARYNLFKYHSPEVMQRYLDADKENILPCRDMTTTHPAIHPGYDLPELDVEEYVQSFTSHDQAIHDLGEPRHLSCLTPGQPKNSSIIQRRSKRETSSSIRLSQQYLPATTYGQSLKPDIASFFRANSRYSTTSFKESQTPPVRISKKPTYGDSPRVKKRSARESFDLVDLCHENIERAHREATQETPRGSFDLVELIHENIAREQSRKRPRLDTTPITPVSARLPPTPSSIVSSNFQGSPMATALKGYPGQFSIHKPQRPSRSDNSTKHVFGNHLHANGEMVNLNFIPDSAPNNPDLSDFTDIGTTIEHANLHHSFAEEILRSDEEEELRTEAYRECAAARLHGIPVGYYRYFAGHMTVEEYNEAKMCVCWEGCWCNKMCTHFGDLACPCAEDLVVGEEI